MIGKKESGNENECWSCLLRFSVSVLEMRRIVRRTVMVNKDVFDGQGLENTERMMRDEGMAWLI